MYKFICGCTTKYDGSEWRHPEDEKAIPTFDSIGYDAEGFLICRIHDSRLYGWRMVRMNGPQGNIIVNYYGTWHRDAVIAGEAHSVKIVSECPDLRDDRDPEELGKEMLALRRSTKKKFHRIANEVLLDF